MFGLLLKAYTFGIIQQVILTTIVWKAQREAAI